MINFTQNNNPQDDDTGSQGTRVVQREADQGRFAESDNAPGVAGAAAAAVLMGINGRFKGRRLSIPPGHSTLGRHAANDVVGGEGSVSQMHARLVFAT